MNSVKCSLDPHSVPKSLFPKLLGVLQMDSFGCQLSLEQSELKRATGIQEQVDLRMSDLLPLAETVYLCTLQLQNSTVGFVEVFVKTVLLLSHFSRVRLCATP